MQMLIPWRIEDTEEVGRKIASRREELGLSQDDLADRIDSNRGNINRCENAKSKMNICTFFQICEALETDPTEMAPERFNNRWNTSKQDEMNRMFSQLGEEAQELLLQTARMLMKNVG